MKETNMEHFRGDIEAVGYCISLHNGEVRDCNEGSFNCLECGFQNMYEDFGCQRAIIRWLMSPYKPEPVLTAREKGFVERIGHGWIAADEKGFKMWYEKKPYKTKEPNVWIETKVIPINDDYFNFITWEDEEPWSVEELRKLKVKEVE